MSETPVTGAPVLSEIDTLISGLCLRLNECDAAVSTTTCETALGGDDGNGLGEKIGLGEDQFTVTEIREGLADGTMTVNESVKETCEEAIAEIACADVTAGFSASDYSTAEPLIPISCQNLFIPSDS